MEPTGPACGSYRYLSCWISKHAGQYVMRERQAHAKYIDFIRWRCNRSEIEVRGFWGGASGTVWQLFKHDLFGFSRVSCAVGWRFQRLWVERIFVLSVFIHPLSQRFNFSSLLFVSSIDFKMYWGLVREVQVSAKYCAVAWLGVRQNECMLCRIESWSPSRKVPWTTYLYAITELLLWPTDL